MQKLLIAAIIGLGLTAQAQTNPGPFWAEQPVFTNVLMGALATVPLSTNGYKAALWTAQKWNAQYGLSGTNRYGVRDVIACAAWHKIESLVPEWQAELDAVADRQKIRSALTEATEAQLNQIKAILGL